MTSEGAGEGTGEGTAETGRDDEDRVVSRRVDNPTTATPQDESAYRAADPLPDSGPEDSYRGATGGISEHVDGDVDDGSEPRRSE